MADKKLRVLLVEDNPGEAELIRQSLTGPSAADIELAWEDRLASAFRRLQSEDFHLVLLDLSLPDCWGPDTFATLHARFPMIPVVVLTGIDVADFATEALRLGAQDYLVKGAVSADALLRAIRFAVERQGAFEAR